MLNVTVSPLRINLMTKIDVIIMGKNRKEGSWKGGMKGQLIQILEKKINDILRKTKFYFFIFTTMILRIKMESNAMPDYERITIQRVNFTVT